MAFETLKRLIGRLGRPDETEVAARALYTACVTRGREPRFYTRLGVPDTLEGRFDLLALHVVLVLRRLRAGDSAQGPLAQRVFDVMFDDMDDQLREMGFGDAKVARKVRGFAEDLMGRAGAYDAALAEDGDDALRDVVRRNVYDGAPDRPGDVDRLADYVRRTDAALGAQDAASLGAVPPAFPEPLIDAEAHQGAVR